MHDELSSAYAVLGLRPGAPPAKVKKQFKALVRRWHPDRFANDPQGAAEANHQLRVINAAYSTILGATAWAAGAGPEARARPGSATPGSASDRGAGESAPDAARPIAERLTRDQIDAIIAALTADTRRRPLREQFRDDPLNRGGAAALVLLYMIGRVWMAARQTGPPLADAAGPMPGASGAVISAVIETMLWSLPLLFVIWHGNARSKGTAWAFLLLFALALPVLLAAMR